MKATTFVKSKQTSTCLVIRFRLTSAAVKVAEHSFAGGQW